MAQGISKGAAALQTQAIVNHGNEKGKSMVSNLKRWDQEVKLKEQGIEVPDGRERNLRFDQAVRGEFLSSAVCLSHLISILLLTNYVTLF